MPSLKSRVLDLYARVMFDLGVSHPRRMPRSSFLILTFHRVLPDALRARYPIPGLVVTPEELRWIVAALAPFFEVDTVSVNCARQADEPGARPLLSVSFDDGQLDNLLYAAPVLEELGIAGTFYLPTDYIGSERLLWHDEAAFAWQSSSLSGAQRREILAELGADDAESARTETLLSLLKCVPVDSRRGAVAGLVSKVKFEPPQWARLMDWSEAQTLADAGHEIGSHCRSHELLPQLDTDSQSRELRGSMETIAACMDSEKAPSSVCYPNGDCSAETLRLAREAGYRNGVTTRWGINSPDQDRFALLRCDMDARRLRSANGSLSAARLGVRVFGHQPGLR